MSTRSDPESRAEALLRASFGRSAEAVASASGRVNLIGDHVDYAGGPVLPLAIAPRTAVAVARANGGRDEALSEWTGDAGWMRYAFGVLAELRADGLDLPPMALSIASDLPVGAGLGSSAALEIAIARAACAILGIGPDPARLALLCQRAERLHAGTPCGVMDQWCVAHASPGEAIHLDCTTLAWRSVRLPSELRIEIVDSGVRHALRDGGYAARRADVEEAARRIGVARLADLASAEPDAIAARIASLPERLARRARHVVSECIRVGEFARLLDAGPPGATRLERLGELLLESHRSLRDDFEVSTPELDGIVERARAAGALGARMTGGGFGGCAIVAWRG